MTVIEYAEKLGLNLTDSQKGILNIWQESDFHNENFILYAPRSQGRQLIYNLIQRYKGYQQGRADAEAEICRKFAERLKEKAKPKHEGIANRQFYNYFCDTVDEVLAEMETE